MKKQKINRQIEARGIDESRIIQAIESVDRTAFLPAALHELAYEDLHLPIDSHIYLPRLYVTARWLQLLDVREGEKVLLLGVDSGYLLSILARLAAEVYAIDDQDEYIEFIERILQQEHIDNVHFKIGSITGGWTDHAPYDKIFLARELREIPEALQSQLKEGGKAVMPVGPDWSQLYLEVMEKDEKGKISRKYISDSYFIPKPSVLPSIPEKQASAEETVDAIKRIYIPFEEIKKYDINGLLERIGDARVVLFGEASHGSSEFYSMRQEISKALIEQKGFRIIGAEADWPDMEIVNRYVHGRLTGNYQMPFKRFPQWMWRNAEFLEFTEWLKIFNERNEDKASIYGLDLYGLQNSVHHILQFLEEKDPDLAEEARKHYACITPYQEDPSVYGQLVLSGRLESCEQEVMQMLIKLLKERERFNHDNEAFYYVYQNALGIVDAERYYKIMYYGGADSWNLRDLHMFHTLRSLMAFHGPDTKAIIWAHNSHIGNALATQMYARGEINIGHLCKESFGDKSYHIGFATDHGTVAAADNWGDVMKIKRVNPALADSYETLMHRSGSHCFSLPLRQNNAHADAIELLASPRLERAIGVIYRPDTERQSHYFLASLPAQFDELIWFDETQAVKALLQKEEKIDLPALHPFASLDE